MVALSIQTLAEVFLVSTGSGFRGPVSFGLRLREEFRGEELGAHHPNEHQTAYGIDFQAPAHTGWGLDSRLEANAVRGSA